VKHDPRTKGKTKPSAQGATSQLPGAVDDSVVGEPDRNAFVNGREINGPIEKKGKGKNPQQVTKRKEGWKVRKQRIISQYP